MEDHASYIMDVKIVQTFEITHLQDDTYNFKWVVEISLNLGWLLLDCVGRKRIIEDILKAISAPTVSF